jgi:16S rRNA G1207 methylase RsmC
MPESPPPVLTSVAVDVGEGYGALVITADSGRDQQEIEIVDESMRRQHAVVHRTSRNGEHAYQAVFPSLREGRYGVVGRPGTFVEIRSGEVSEVPLRQCE